MTDPVTKSRDPSFIEKVEDALLDRLRVMVDGSVKVQAFPGDPSTFDFTGLNAALLVHYSGSNFTARRGSANPNQDRRMNFALVLLIRELRGSSGAYRVLEDVRLAVQGVPFNGAGPAEIISDKLIAENEGQWRFEIMIGLNAPAVARDAVQPPSPLFQPATASIPGRV